MHSSQLAGHQTSFLPVANQMKKDTLLHSERGNGGGGAVCHGMSPSLQEKTYFFTQPNLPHKRRTPVAVSKEGYISINCLTAICLNGECRYTQARSHERCGVAVSHCARPAPLYVPCSSVAPLSWSQACLRGVGGGKLPTHSRSHMSASLL